MIGKEKMKYYLFDFDGTLVDSMPTYAAMMLRILDENKISYGDDIIKIITPLGYKGTAEYFKSIGLDMELDAILAKMVKYAVFEYENTIEAKENVISTLKALKERGASLNVLTASPHIMLDPCLKRLGIFGLFDNVWSCDDFNTTKADPEIYKMAAKRLGASVEDVVFLDDNYNADKTAASAGMKVIGVYDPTSEEFTEEIKSVCDRYIRDFSELL
jgi:HAD superfamily hydrolase (TIGR01509 family)